MGDTKQCTRCSETKELSQFAVDKSKSSGRKSACKACDSAKSSEYYARNREDRQRYAREHVRYNAEDARQDRLAIRASAIRVYGGACVGCSSTESLQFDHVNDDGSEHREAESHHAMLRRIARTGQRIPEWELQLLCPSCHRAKTAKDRAAKVRYRH